MTVPDNWSLVQLGDAVEVGSSQIDPAKQPDREFFYIQLEDIAPGEGRLIQENHVLGKAIGSNKTAFGEGDVLYGRLRPYLRKVVVAQQPGIAVTDLVPLRTRGHVLSEYVKNYLLSPYHSDYIAPLMSGIRMPRLRASDLQEMPFPLPPLNEQCRIVAKLEELSARNRSARAALDAIPPLLDRFRQSILAAAFCGDLTADWRAKNPNVEPSSELLRLIRIERRHRWEEAKLQKLQSNGRTIKDNQWKSRYEPAPPPDLEHETRILPKSWSWASVGEISECLDYLRVPVNREERARRIGPYPYFGANGQVGTIDDYIFDESLVLVTEDETFYGRTKPIAYTISGKSWVNNHAHVLRPIKPINPAFLCYALAHFPVFPWLSGTTGRAKLTQRALNSLPIALPPLAELHQLTERIDHALDAVKTHASMVEQMGSRVALLNQSVLARAFRGELVHQHPDDEPATVLLERIRAKREAAHGNCTQKRGRHTK